MSLVPLAIALLLASGMPTAAAASSMTGSSTSSTVKDASSRDDYPNYFECYYNEDGYHAKKYHCYYEYDGHNYYWWWKYNPPNWWSNH